MSESESGSGADAEPGPRVEVLDLTTPTGRAMAGMLAVFAEFEREVLRLKAQRVSHAEIARRLGIGRTSVRRILAAD